MQSDSQTENSDEDSDTAKRRPIIEKSRIYGDPPIVRFDKTAAVRQLVSKSNYSLRVFYAGPLSRIVYNIFLEAGYVSTRGDGVPKRFSICWGTARSHEFYCALSPGYIVNQWPGSAALGNKSVMGRCAMCAAKRNAAFNCFPKTFIVPSDLVALEAEMSAHPQRYYIYKPASANRGEGIRILRFGDRFDRGTEAVMQQYLGNPVLINGHKFDLRLYVLITSVDPFIAYVHRRGLARFAAAEYAKPTRKNKVEATMHLTNYSVNKDADSGDFETKWELADLIDYLSAHPELFESDATLLSGNIKQNIWYQIVNTVRLGLLTAEPKLFYQAHATHTAHAFPRRNFGLYGFDVIITRTGRFYLLEMNICPSTATGSDLDYSVKFEMLTNTLDLVAPHAFRRAPKFDNRPSAVRHEFYIPQQGEFKGFQLENGEIKLSYLESDYDFAFDTLTRFEKRCLFQLWDEQQRINGYLRVLPEPETTHLFETPRYLSILAARYIYLGMPEIK